MSPLEGIRTALSNANSLRHAAGCNNNRLIDVFSGEMTVEYFKGRGFEGSPVHVETVEKGEFFWFDLPSSDLDIADFSARMTATFVPQETGEHVFGMTNAGLARLLVDGELAVDGYDGWTKGENFLAPRTTSSVGR